MSKNHFPKKYSSRNLRPKSSNGLSPKSSPKSSNGLRSKSSPKPSNGLHSKSSPKSSLGSGSSHKSHGESPPKAAHESPLPSFLQNAPLSEIADFITSHLHGLHAMAVAANWPEMTYYLEMAIIEAEKQAEGHTGYARLAGQAGQAEQTETRKIRRQVLPLSHP